VVGTIGRLKRGKKIVGMKMAIELFQDNFFKDFRDKR